MEKWIRKQVTSNLYKLFSKSLFEMMQLSMGGLFNLKVKISDKLSFYWEDTVKMKMKNNIQSEKFQDVFHNTACQ